MINLPVYIVILPLFGAILCPLFMHFSKFMGRAIVVIAVGTALVLSIIQIYNISETEMVSYWMGGYIPPLGIEFMIDSLSATIIILILAIGFLSILYSMPFLKNETKLKTAGYFTVLSLLITGLLGMTSTRDIFNLYVFLEITSISGYALIAMGGDRGVLSSFRYLLIGTIGASFYLFGVAFIYAETGTLNMDDMSGRVGPILTTGTTLVAMTFFIIGFGIKMALFPLHGWQPAAYTNSHPGAAPMITGVMGKIPAYAMLRFFFFVFNANTDFVAKSLLIIGIMSACGMIYGSVKAIGQKDFRGMLAYSSIAQIGYVGLGIAITGYFGLIGAVLHIIGHACMKSCLFFCAGAIQFRYGEVKMKRFGQLYKKMPMTTTAIVISALSMVGIPPFTGFFSKWYLALGAMQKGLFIYVAILIVSSLLNAIYFFRLLERIFMNREAEPYVDADGKMVPKLSKYAPEASDVGESNLAYTGKREMPILMAIPIIVTTVSIIMIGIFNTKFVDVLSSAIMVVAR